MTDGFNAGPHIVSGHSTALERRAAYLQSAQTSESLLTCCAKSSAGAPGPARAATHLLTGHLQPNPASGFKTIKIRITSQEAPTHLKTTCVLWMKFLTSAEQGKFTQEGFEQKLPMESNLRKKGVAFIPWALARRQWKPHHHLYPSSKNKGKGGRVQGEGPHARSIYT